MNTEQQQSHLTSDCGGDASKTALAGHTPGPWRCIVVGPNNLDRGTTMVATTFHDGMAIDCERSGRTFDECAANARLIAAAPDLLEALQRIVAHPLFAPCECGLPDCTTTVARAALAKAGVTP